MSGAKPFLDTNIFLYGLDRSDTRKAKIASDLLDQLLLTENGVVSYQVVQEFVSVALRRFPATMTGPELVSYIRTVFERFEMIRSSIDLIESGLHLRDRYQFSWYDSLIVAAALEANCDVLYTEDLQHGQQIGAMTIVNPFL